MPGEYIQIDSNTCGLAVCCKIIFDIKGEKVTQKSLLDIIKIFNFSKNGWKDEFFSKKIGVPTEILVELLLKVFGIKYAKSENISLADIKENGVMAVLEYSKGQYHAVLINMIKNDIVFYFNPTTGEEEKLTLQEFNLLRQPKTDGDNRIFLEIIHPLSS